MSGSRELRDTLVTEKLEEGKCLQVPQTAKVEEPHLSVNDELTKDTSEGTQDNEPPQSRESVFSSLIPNLYDLITIHDALGIVTYVSPSVTRLLGYNPEDMIGRPPAEFIHPEDLPLVLAANQKVMARVTPTVPIEYRFRHANGSWVYLESVGSRLEDPAGISGIVVTTRELPVSRSTPRGFVYQDRDGRIFSANSVAEEILGMNLEEMAGITSLDPCWRAIRENGTELPGDQHPAMLALRTEQIVRDVIMGVMNPKENAHRWIIVYSVPLFLPGDATPFQVYSTFIDITEQKRAEESLRISENRYRSLFGHMAEGVALHQLIRDAEGCAFDYEIIDVNPQYELTLNLPLEQVVHKRATEVYRTTEPPYLKEFARVAETGIPHRFETHFAPMDRFFDISVVSPEKNQFATIFTDITGRKQMEEALRESEDSLRKILGLLPIGIAVTNLDGACEYLNEKFVEMFGYTQDDLPDIERWWIMAFPDTVYRNQIRQTWNAKVRQASTIGGGIQPSVRRVCCKGGGFKEIEFRTTIVGNRLITLFDDVTEKKRAEDALRESERRFRELLENVNLVAVMLDTQGRITFCNDQLLRVSGWSRQELIGRNWFEDCVQGSEGNQVRDFFYNSILDSTIPAHLEYPILSRYGRTRLVAWDNTVLRGPDGAVIGVAGLGRDISEQRILEEQLRQAQKMESIGRLAGGVAHDFNNLLTAINGYAELILADIGTEDPIYSSVQAVHNAGEQAAALTRQLLAFSRKQVLQPKVLDLNGLIQESSRMLRRLIGEDVQLVTILDPELKSVKADPGQLEQVILNLAVNARDAMPQGGMLSLETANAILTEGFCWKHVSVPPGEYVMLSVTDTGSGMDAETVNHIFEPFFTTKGVGKGTGLGLSTVYGIIQQSSGHIGVHSEPGKGTTFKIYLPMVDELAEIPQSYTRLLEVPHGTEAVLVVEDEETVRELACLSLRMVGYEVLKASNGKEALLVCQRHPSPIHLLLTDVVMPQMGGRDLARRLIQIRPDMKVLFMSGYTDHIVSHDGVLDPGLEYIQKPFSPEGLLRKVREVLDSTEKGTVA